jgi:hypothetical protein
MVTNNRDQSVENRVFGMELEGLQLSEKLDGRSLEGCAFKTQRSGLAQ